MTPPTRSRALALVPIGLIHTPYLTVEECPKHARGACEPSIITVLPAFIDGLLGIESATHLHVLYWLDRSDRTLLQRCTPHDGIIRGVFANRSAARPNPIGLSVVRLFERQGPVLTVGGLDCTDGTALLDLKPYVPAGDCVRDATLHWLDNRGEV